MNVTIAKKKIRANFGVGVYQIVTGSKKFYERVLETKCWARLENTRSATRRLKGKSGVFVGCPWKYGLVSSIARKEKAKLIHKLTFDYLGKHP